MANIKIYHIINRITRKEKFSGSYENCLEHYNEQDKAYRKNCKIIDDKEFNKLIKKNPKL